VCNIVMKYVGNFVIYIVLPQQNRLHAKKTRLRKKLVLQVSSMMISSLEDEIRRLRSNFNRCENFGAALDLWKMKSPSATVPGQNCGGHLKNFTVTPIKSNSSV
jgi:hypothetical protein